MKYKIYIIALSLFLFGCNNSSITKLSKPQSSKTYEKIQVLMDEKPNCDYTSLAIIQTRNHFNLDSAIETAKKEARGLGASHLMVKNVHTTNDPYVRIDASALLCE